MSEFGSLPEMRQQLPIEFACRRQRAGYVQRMALILANLVLAIPFTELSGPTRSAWASPSRVQRNVPAPPPVAEIYDPQEGPFIVRRGPRNEVGPEQRGVIANAVKSWTGERLQSLQICHSTRGAVDWKAYAAAMDAVSRALKPYGARVVTMPNGGLCRSDHRANIAGPYIEINGIVSL